MKQLLLSLLCMIMIHSICYADTNLSCDLPINNGQVVKWLVTISDNNDKFRITYPNGQIFETKPTVSGETLKVNKFENHNGVLIYQDIVLNRYTLLLNSNMRIEVEGISSSNDGGTDYSCTCKKIERKL